MLIKSKIAYNCYIDGEIKAVTESFLHDVLTWGEVETTANELFIKRIPKFSPVDNIDNLGKVKFNDVFFYPLKDEDSFWKVTLTVFAEKKYKYVVLLAAVSNTEASERVTEQCAKWTDEYKITAVDETDILAVYRPDNELWNGDWHNRQERLYDAGKYQVDWDEVSKAEAVPDNQMDAFPDLPKSDKKRKGKKSGITSVTVSALNRDTGEWDELGKISGDEPDIATDGKAKGKAKAK